MVFGAVNTYSAGWAALEMKWRGQRHSIMEVAINKGEDGVRSFLS